MGEGRTVYHLLCSPRHPHLPIRQCYCEPLPSAGQELSVSNSSFTCFSPRMPRSAAAVKKCPVPALIGGLFFLHRGLRAALLDILPQSPFQLRDALLWLVDPFPKPVYRAYHCPRAAVSTFRLAGHGDLALSPTFPPSTRSK